MLDPIYLRTMSNQFKQLSEEFKDVALNKLQEDTDRRLSRIATMMQELSEDLACVMEQMQCPSQPK